MTASDWKKSNVVIFLTKSTIFSYTKNNFEKWRVYENCSSWSDWTCW